MLKAEPGEQSFPEFRFLGAKPIAGSRYIKNRPFWSQAMTLSGPALKQNSALRLAS